MTSIFPDGGNGGVEVRDEDGNPIPVNNVPNAYVPAAGFSVSCSFSYLRDDCFSRISPTQMNSVVSELVCFTEFLDPEGAWNCSELCNIRKAFESWVSRFVSDGISTDLCAVPSSDASQSDAALIYCGNGTVLKFGMYGEGGLFELVQDYLCTQATPVPATSITTSFLGCTPEGGWVSLTLEGIRLYRGEWVQTRGYPTNTMVQRSGRLWSPNAAITAGTPFAIGTVGMTWREVSPSPYPTFIENQDYVKDSVVQVDGKLYAANALVPAGTPFTIGTSGATWRLIDIGQAYALDYNSAATYTKDALVVFNGKLYRAKNNVPPSGSFNPTQWQLVSGDANKYLGEWLQAPAYNKDDMVLVGSKLYVANDAIPAGSPFVVGAAGASWREASPTTLTGIIYDTEFVFSATGGWAAGETLFAYVAARATTILTGAPGSVGASREGSSVLNTTASILIDDIVVGSISFVGEDVTFDFPLTRTINPGSILRLEATADAAFDYVAITFYVRQLL